MAPYRPRIERGGDEYCNPSVIATLPLLGTVLVFYRPGPLRTEPCDTCRKHERFLAESE